MGRRIALDTNVFVYALENQGKLGDGARDLLQRIKAEKPIVYTSVITIHEVLTGVYKKGMAEKVPDYVLAITGDGLIRIVDFTQQIALTSAQIRAKYGLKTPDAIQIASAISAGASTFFTGDKRIPRKIGKLTVKGLA